MNSSSDDESTEDINAPHTSSDEETDTDSDELNDHGIYKEMEDLVVPDDDPEHQFSFADEDDSLDVRDIHSAVHEYNEWVPSTQKDKQLKQYIDTFEEHAASNDADLVLESGGPPKNYKKPPTKFRRKGSKYRDE